MAKGIVSGLPGEHQFHFKDIPKSWLKVDLSEIMLRKVLLLFPNLAADQELIEDVLGTSAMWHGKHVKFIT